MEVLWVILTLLVAAGVGWPVTIGVLKIARSVDEHGDSTAKKRTIEYGTPGRTLTIVVPDPPAHEPGTPAPPVDGSALRETTDSAEPPETPAMPRPGVLRGGLVIGILERLGVAAAILANEPVAIAYVVAIKGLGRYAELKETPAVAERFIIGTLASLLWAAAVAVLAARYLL
ncbi:hypothetical protein [Arthrobacter sp. 260]|uniref:hypothetical protein n=1 Tax=Arthrobacter sp. 260 TaxID=2735314 RepID=UPI0014908AA0|nr:hypothetical protein [Arthrobacter sp. 260]NOJ61761.1 hypothetical protein [Arthrobacter sp. 260]